MAYMGNAVESINAETYDRPLRALAETIAQKVLREGFRRQNVPSFVATDLFVMMRQAQRTYDLLTYLNADERREHDCHWSTTFSFLSAPLVRSMIDCLYNITLVLRDPRFYGPAWRKSGYKQESEALAEDEKRYGGQVNWDAHLKEKRWKLHAAIENDGFTLTEISEQKKWLTLGAYLGRLEPGGVLNDHQTFLKTFTYGMWRNYSALLHGGFDGLMDVGPYLIRDALKDDFKSQVDEAFPRLMSQHIARAALILLCIITEVQAYFLFKDANINARIEAVWQPLMPVFEVGELYRERYEKLMRDKGMIA